MASIKEALRNKLIETVAEAAENEIDGRELTKKLDATLDEKFGPSTSEKLQHGPMTKFLFELVEGLWDEDPEALILWVKEWLEKKETAKS